MEKRMEDLNEEMRFNHKEYEDALREAGKDVDAAREEKKNNEARADALEGQRNKANSRSHERRRKNSKNACTRLRACETKTTLATAS